MSTVYQIKKQDKLYYLTFQVAHWINVSTRNRYRDILRPPLLITLLQETNIMNKMQGINIF
jgi:hypothetical protein